MGLKISSHAVERYRERVKPGLSFARCENELGTLVLSGNQVPELPYERYGYGVPEDGPEADSYIELAPRIWAVVVNSSVVTCFTEVSSSPERRTRRNTAKAAYRRSKQRKRKEYFFKAGSRRTRMAPER